MQQQAASRGAVADADPQHVGDGIVDDIRAAAPDAEIVPVSGRTSSIRTRLGRGAVRDVARTPDLRAPRRDRRAVDAPAGNRRRRLAAGAPRGPHRHVRPWGERDPDRRVRARRDARLREGLPRRWLEEPPEHWNFASSASSRARRVGLVGLGGIGTAVARRALAFDMRVRALRRTQPGRRPPGGVEVVMDLDDLLRDRRPPRARGARYRGDQAPARRRRVRRVKPGVHLVNIARGSRRRPGRAPRGRSTTVGSRWRASTRSTPSRSPRVTGCTSTRRCGSRAHVSWASPERVRRGSFEPFAAQPRAVTSRASRSRASSTSTRATDGAGAIVVGTGLRRAGARAGAACGRVRRARRWSAATPSAPRAGPSGSASRRRHRSRRRARAARRRRGDDRHAAATRTPRSRSLPLTPASTCCARSRSRSMPSTPTAMLDAAEQRGRHAPRGSRVPMGTGAGARSGARSPTVRSVSRASSRFVQYVPLVADPEAVRRQWWFDLGAGGGWLGASGSHIVDQVRMWLGEFAGRGARARVRVAPPRHRRRHVHDPLPARVGGRGRAPADRGRLGADGRRHRAWLARTARSGIDGPHGDGSPTPRACGRSPCPPISRSRAARPRATTRAIGSRTSSSSPFTRLCEVLLAGVEGRPAAEHDPDPDVRRRRRRDAQCSTPCGRRRRTPAWGQLFPPTRPARPCTRECRIDPGGCASRTGVPAGRAEWSLRAAERHDDRGQDVRGEVEDRGELLRERGRERRQRGPEPECRGRQQQVLGRREH